jgi:outer membrane protein OmpA-like peptidoglycan-associated protein
VKWKPHIIHFIGHGGFDDEKGLIFLHSGKDPAARDAIDSASLRELVRKDPPWLVVLNSCLSGAAAKADPFAGAAQNLIRANIPFVVAMQAPISDDAAVQFSQDFYAALASGETVATAVSSGRNGIRTLEDESLQAELITPVLYSTGKAERIKVRKSWWALLRGFWEIDPADPSTSGMTGMLQVILALAGLVVAVLGIVLTFYMSSGGPVVEPSTRKVASAAPSSDDRELYVESNTIADASEGDALAVPEDTGDYGNAAAGAAPPYPTSSPAPRGDLEFRPARAPAPAEVGPGAQIGSHPSAPPEEDPALTSALEDQILVEPVAAEIDRPTAAQPPSPPSRPAPRTPSRPVLRPRLPVLAAIARPARPIRPAGPEATPVYYREDDRQARSEPLASAGWRIDGPLPAYLSTIGLPSSGEVALFQPDSAVPAQIDIGPYVAALARPVDEAATVELVGTAAPGESAIGGSEPGMARAAIVAAALRDSGIASERVLVASAGDRWVAASFEPELQRAVEARLVLRGADRVGFAPDSAAVAPEYADRLDRVAAFARDNPRYGLRLEGHAQTIEHDPFVLARQRIDSVRTELSGRGLDEQRVAVRIYADTHPEVIGQPGADADRRVQIVLVPPFEPTPLPLSAPPPDPPRQP